MKPKRTNREVYPQALRLACAKRTVVLYEVGPGVVFLRSGLLQGPGLVCLVVATCPVVVSQFRLEGCLLKGCTYFARVPKGFIRVFVGFHQEPTGAPLTGTFVIRIGLGAAFVVQPHTCVGAIKGWSQNPYRLGQYVLELRGLVSEGSQGKIDRLGETGGLFIGYFGGVGGCCSSRPWDR